MCVDPRGEAFPHHLHYDIADFKALSANEMENILITINNLLTAVDNHVRCMEQWIYDTLEALHESYHSIWVERLLDDFNEDLMVEVD